MTMRHLIAFFLLLGFSGCAVPNYELFQEGTLAEYRLHAKYNPVGVPTDIVIYEEPEGSAYLIVSNYSKSALEVFDISGAEVVNTIELGFSPTRMTLDARRGILYVAGTMHIAQIEIHSSEIKSVRLSDRVLINQLVWNEAEDALFFNNFSSPEVYLLQALEFKVSESVLELGKLPRVRSDAGRIISFRLAEDGKTLLANHLFGAQISLQNVVRGGPPTQISIRGFETTDAEILKSTTEDTEKYVLILAENTGLATYLEVLKKKVSNQTSTSPSFATDSATTTNDVWIRERSLLLWHEPASERKVAWSAISDLEVREMLEYHQTIITRDQTGRFFIYSPIRPSVKVMEAKPDWSTFCCRNPLPLRLRPESVEPEGEIVFPSAVLRLAASASGRWLAASHANGELTVIRRNFGGGGDTGGGG